MPRAQVCMFTREIDPEPCCALACRACSRVELAINSLGRSYLAWLHRFVDCCQPHAYGSDHHQVLSTIDIILVDLVVISARLNKMMLSAIHV